MARFGFFERHWYDAKKKPAGGVTSGRGFVISWQNGPLGPQGMNPELREPNGAFVEDIIQAAMSRILFYQGTEFRSGYNERAIVHLREALAALDERTRDREQRGVEGTHQV